ncbi:hypothetical protein GXW83_17805 [Streptacidiphilus sp. PB12-B1b]|uniref:hypothetical protein n=1 Tax=Streptacidiphilus sp. PB12-B1b TaxID=2705012 RepID=UPI0015FCCB56|nr:hypothetical protein [Streptacidiphilus sp. PB12-B1b]QMU77274.1 hypothetical protein GXW83_17805 [Streptacidiphilus sp. PB12-B1b]
MQHHRADPVSRPTKLAHRTGIGADTASTRAAAPRRAGPAATVRHGKRPKTR